MSFELLDHPADVGFRVRSTSLEELFAGCAQALVSLILDPSRAERKLEITIEAEGSDYESLLVNWLNEVLYYVDSRRIVFAEFEVGSMSQTRVSCTASGEARDPTKHPGRLVVKAVTYHQLKVVSTADGWLAEVYVDV